MTQHELILNYIKQFRNLGAENCFANGMCYHFTVLLRQRFGSAHCSILYDQVANHFATLIEGRIYDITGDITENQEYHWERWSDVRQKDHALEKRIRRDCILKIPNGEQSCELCSHCFYDEILNSFLCDIDNQPVNTYGVCQKEK